MGSLKHYGSKSKFAQCIVNANTVGNDEISPNWCFHGRDCPFEKGLGWVEQSGTKIRLQRYNLDDLKVGLPSGSDFELDGANCKIGCLQHFSCPPAMWIRLNHHWPV